MRQVSVLSAAALALALSGCSYIYGHGEQSHEGANPAAAGSAASSHKKPAGGTASAAEVKQAQQELQSQGFYHGKIDGIAGPETKQALKDFQQKNGLQQTGSLDEHTLSALNGAASSGSTTPPNGTSPAETAPAAAPGSGTATSPSATGTGK